MHHKRRRPRSASSSKPPFPPSSRKGESPAHWNILFHSRPRRRRDDNSARLVLRGADPDALLWDPGNRRPHVWYW